MSHQDTLAWIKQTLTEALQPSFIEVSDKSHQHRHHPGASAGGGHFVLKISAKAFEDKPLLASHRMIYEALGDAMQKEIHALSIQIVAED